MIVILIVLADNIFLPPLCLYSPSNPTSILHLSSSTLSVSLCSPLTLPLHLLSHLSPSTLSLPLPPLSLYSHSTLTLPLLSLSHPTPSTLPSLCLSLSLPSPSALPLLCLQVVAAASLGQVYKAILRSDFSEVSIFY